MFKRVLHLMVATVMAVTLGAAYAGDAKADDNRVYTQPGHHLVNGRYWQTSCEMYSTTVVRCQTDIWADTVVQHNGRWVRHEGWVFNSLTYLPSERESWGSNPLANTGEWTAEDGRKWRTECDTAATGRGACRSYSLSTIVSNATLKPSTDWVINNIVQFSTSNVPAVTTIPAAAPKLDGVPAEQAGKDNSAQRVVDLALTKVGSSYRHAAAGPSSFDCSGLTYWAYKQVGVTLPRTSSSQLSAGTKVSRSNLQPGDLVFYYSPVSHVAIYIGNGKIVDAANYRTGVRVTSVDSMPFAGARRVLNG